MAESESLFRTHRFLNPKRWISFVFTYRIPVYILTFLLIVAPLRYTYVMAHPHIILVALCFSSLMAFVYLFNKVTDHEEDSVNLHGGPITESLHNPVRALSIVCLFAPLGYLIFFPAYLPWYAALALLGYLYSKSIPFLLPPRRLKGMLLIKNMTAALGWTIPSTGVYSVIIPNWSPVAFWTHFFEIFCFSLLVELLWDIRDMEGDKIAGVHTVANTFGVLATQVFATGLLGIFLLLSAPTVYPPALWCIGGVSFGYILLASPKRGAWFYYAILTAWVGVLGAVFFL